MQFHILCSCRYICEPQFNGPMREYIYLSVMHSVRKSGPVTSRNRNKTIARPDVESWPGQKFTEQTILPTRRSYCSMFWAQPLTLSSMVRWETKLEEKSRGPGGHGGRSQAHRSTFNVEAQGYLACFSISKDPWLYYPLRGVPKQTNFKDLPLKPLGMAKNSGSIAPILMSTKGTIWFEFNNIYDVEFSRALKPSMQKDPRPHAPKHEDRRTI